MLDHVVCFLKRCIAKVRLRVGTDHDVPIHGHASKNYKNTIHS